MDADALQFNAADPKAWGERLVHGCAPKAERIAAATREFEAVLLRQYLNEAFKPLNSSSPGMGSGNGVYSYLVTDALANGLTKQGVFGFSTLLQSQVADKAATNDEHTDTNL